MRDSNVIYKLLKSLSCVLFVCLFLVCLFVQAGVGALRRGPRTGSMGVVIVTAEGLRGTERRGRSKGP